MRKLNISDVFKMARIIKAAQVKNTIADIISSVKVDAVAINEDDSEEVKLSKTAMMEKQKEVAGFDAIMSLFEACTTEKLENMLYEFFGDIVGLSPEEVAKQDLEITIEQLQVIAKENNVWDFFKQAGQLMK